MIFFIGLNMSLGMLSVTLAHITFSVGFVALVVQARMSGMDESLTGRPATSVPRPGRLPPGDPAADHAGHRRRRADGLHPVHRRLRDHLLHRRRRFATLPTQIYTMIKIAVTPEVNAVSTLLMLLTLVLIVIASKLSPSAIKGH